MNKFFIIAAAFLGAIFVISCAFSPSSNSKKNTMSTATPVDLSKDAVATFAAGCFWCVEAQFQQLAGVDTVISGYMGGSLPNPTYKDVCTGTTGHAEVCNVYFNPAVISYVDLLQAFFVCHDPTQLNRQGNDVGTQYRSAIFYHDTTQKEAALNAIAALDKSGSFSKPIVTEVSPYTTFYTAENYHQNYYNQNGDQPYCAFVVRPKREHFEKVFKDKLKYK
jgi:peptide-methionine (S)-S-oxide reductase